MGKNSRNNEHIDQFGTPFDPVKNEYPHNKQLVFPGNLQSTFGTFGMFGVNLLNDPNIEAEEDPEKGDSYLYL